ncbi:MAG TPA: NusA N-terminal domain-containing protein [bacterium]|nr:NusA N-terminal domain-containing protein [bacterium]
MDFNLKELVDQLVKMKGIKRELIVDILKEALYQAVKKKLGSDADIDIMFDDATGELRRSISEKLLKVKVILSLTLILKRRASLILKCRSEIRSESKWKPMNLEGSRHRLPSRS